jgi:GT2 family glycosyltransferase
VTDPTLAIVVVNYGSADLLVENLKPLGSAVTDARGVVVDSYSTATERERVRVLAAECGWDTVLPDRNTGFGGGMNLGVRRAAELGVRELLLLNPDAAISPASLALLRERIREDPLRLVAPRILRPDGSIWFAGADLYSADGRIRSSRRRSPELGPFQPWITGACMALTLRLWEIVGGFDEDYFLYWEDVDLSRRVVERAGGSLEVCAESTAVHAEGGTQGEGRSASGTAKSDAYYYYNIRNRLLFAARNLSDADIRRWMRVSTPVAYEILLQGGRRQFLTSLSPIRAALRGLRDGRSIARHELERRKRTGSDAPVTGGRN